MLGTWESRENKENIASIKNIFFSTCWWKVLADKIDSAALQDLTQLQNISTTTSTSQSNLKSEFAVILI